MTVNNPESFNKCVAADDLLQEYLERMTLLEGVMDQLHGDDRLTSFHQINAFALLYIADKLDSIDTRLMHLVHQLEKRHE